jgi:hypothetical protein
LVCYPHQLTIQRKLMEMSYYSAIQSQGYVIVGLKI